jgi:hypothetical protein
MVAASTWDPKLKSSRTASGKVVAEAGTAGLALPQLAASVSRWWVAEEWRLRSR